MVGRIANVMATPKTARWSAVRMGNGGVLVGGGSPSMMSAQSLTPISCVFPDKVKKERLRSKRERERRREGEK